MRNAVAAAPRKQGHDEWEVREALQTLAKARKIQENKKLMALVKAEATRQLAAATKQK